MTRDIGLVSEDFLIKDDVDEREVKKSKKFDINAVETDSIKIIGFDRGIARILVDNEEFVVPKSKVEDFKRIIGNRRRDISGKKIRFKFEKKPEHKVPYILDIWENKGDPVVEDAVLIGEKLALFISGKSDVVDIASSSKDNEPFKFIGKRIRVPLNIAVRRGYNVADTKDLRLKSEGKIVGEVMYKCGRLYDNDNRSGVDICFGVKIRETGDGFVAEKIARFIDREFISGSDKAVARTEASDRIVNLDVDDIVLDSELIESDDTDGEALRIFENFGFEEINDEFKFFDWTPEGQAAPVIAETIIDYKSEVDRFNSFVDKSIKHGSNLNGVKIKSEFDAKLKKNIRDDGAFARTTLKTLMQVYNDDKLFDRNKTANNPEFYKRFNRFIRGKVIEFGNYKEEAETDFD